jgi:small conductance mechanosensitive channel
MPNDLRVVLQDFLSPDTLHGALFYAVACIAIAWLAGRAVHFAVHRALESHAPLADPTAVQFLGQLSRLAIYVFALLSYIYMIPLLRQFGGVWLTSVGVVSVIVGIAAQSTLGNLISGVSLLLYRPFKLGDRLQVMSPSGLESGVVESLSLGYTTLKTDDDRRILIPNSVMAGQTSINISLLGRRAMAVVTVSVGYNADIKKARMILIECAKANPHKAEFVSCRISALSDSGTTMILTVHCPENVPAAEVKSDLLDAAKKRFDADGIPITH